MFLFRSWTGNFRSAQGFWKIPEALPLFKGRQEPVGQSLHPCVHCNAPGKLLLGFACGPACQEPSGRGYGAWREHG